MPKFEKTPTGPFHSGYGCAILVIMAITFSAIISWCLYTLLQQNKELDAFTTENAKPLPALVLSEGDKATLRGKLSAFAEEANKNQAADLTLTVADMNALLVLAQDNGIGNQEGSAPYVEMLRITGLDAKEKIIRTDLRLPINKLPIIGQGTRHVVGTATFQPMIEGGSFEIKLQNILVPGKIVNEGFIHQLQQLPWLSVAKLKPEIKAALEKVSAYEITADEKALILHAKEK